MTAEDLARSLKPVDPSRFVRIEQYTDPETQAFMVHTPVDLSGNRDYERPVRVFTNIVLNYRGEQYTQGMELQGDSMADCILGFVQQAAKIGAASIERLETEENERKLFGAPSTTSK